MKSHDEWLLKAEHDYKTAKLILENDKSLLDMAIYHTQQSVEKSLNGFLNFHNKPLAKTHNVRLLLEYCVDIEEELKSLMEDVFLVSPFDTLFRYPGQELAPNEETLKRAIKSAERVLLVIRENVNY